MKILYLNLADPRDNATGNTIPVLLKKYRDRDNASWWNQFWAWQEGPSVVERVEARDALAEMQRYVSTPLNQTPPLLTAYNKLEGEVSAFFKKYPTCSKVMAGVHGMYDDVDYAYTENRRDAPKMSWRWVADLLLTLLKDYFQQRELGLSLVMCYGARAKSYKLSHEAINLGSTGGPDLSTSFAYKVYAAMCKNMKVRMSARTGAASFDSQTGQSRVESEFTLLRRIAIQARPVTQEESRSLGKISAFSKFSDRLSPTAKNPFDMDEVRRLDREANLFAEESLELDDLTGNSLLVRAKREAAFSLFSQTSKSKPTKYGKITYRYVPDRHIIEIVCKYPKPERVVQRVSV